MSVSKSSGVEDVALGDLQTSDTHRRRNHRFRRRSGADADDLDIAGVGLGHPVDDDLAVVDVRPHVDGDVIVDDDVDLAEADP